MWGVSLPVPLSKPDGLGVTIRGDGPGVAVVVLVVTFTSSGIVVVVVLVVASTEGRRHSIETARTGYGQTV